MFSGHVGNEADFADVEGADVIARQRRQSNRPGTAPATEAVKFLEQDFDTFKTWFNPRSGECTWQKPAAPPAVIEVYSANNRTHKVRMQTKRMSTVAATDDAHISRQKDATNYHRRPLSFLPRDSRQTLSPLGNDARAATGVGRTLQRGAT
jgi:hypothetical protein